jgi:hypothetical protein
MHWENAGGRSMIEILVAIAGTLLLIAAGAGRKPEPVPVRIKKR